MTIYSLNSKEQHNYIGYVCGKTNDWTTNVKIDVVITKLILDGVIWFLYVLFMTESPLSGTRTFKFVLDFASNAKNIMIIEYYTTHIV